MTSVFYTELRELLRNQIYECKSFDSIDIDFLLDKLLTTIGVFDNKLSLKRIFDMHSEINDSLAKISFTP